MKTMFSRLLDFVLRRETLRAQGIDARTSNKGAALQVLAEEAERQEREEKKAARKTKQ